METSSIDPIIKQTVLDVIRESLGITAPQSTTIGHTIELEGTDRDSINQAFDNIEKIHSYVDNSACIVSLTEEGYFCPSIGLYYETTRETTSIEKLEYLTDRINRSVFFPKLYKKLTELGYKRVGVSSVEFKKYDDTTIWEMYLNDQDRLTEYFQLFFKKGVAHT